MAEIRQTFDELIQKAAIASTGRGASEGLRILKSISSDKEKLPDYFLGMRNGLECASENEKTRLLMLSRIMSLSGLHLPVSALFNLGLPRKEFLLYADLSTGRIGDQLFQLAQLLHAQKVLNIVLCINSKLSSANKIILLNNDSFSTDLPAVELNPSLSEYFKSICKSSVFIRKILQESSRTIFNLIPNEKSYQNLELDKVLITHIRGGDALFDGTLLLPPLRYYTECIAKEDAKKVIILTEPDFNDKYNMENPQPRNLIDYCNKKNIEVTLISNKDVLIDAGVLYWAKRIVASNSHFSKMIPLFSRNCEKLYLPICKKDYINWCKDGAVIEHQCWEGLNPDKWKDLDYRLNWVSQNQE